MSVASRQRLQRPSTRRAASSVASLQAVGLTSPAAHDVQRLLADPCVEDLDMVAVDVDAREWQLLLCGVAGHPRLRRIDLTAAPHLTSNDSERVEALLSAIESNPGITEVCVDDAAVAARLQPALELNRRRQRALQERRREGTEARAAGDVGALHQQEKEVLCRVEQLHRARLVQDRRTALAALRVQFTGDCAAVAAVAEQSRARRGFLDALAEMMRVCFSERYRRYTQHFLAPFGELYVAQEAMGRELLADAEGAARATLRRRGFASYAVQARRLKHRLEEERKSRAAVVEAALQAKQELRQREERLRGILGEALADHALRTAQLERDVAHRIEEDAKRRQQRMAELDVRRQLRLERLAKDQARAATHFQSEGDKLHRAELLGRMRIVQEEPQVFRELQDLFKFMAPVAAAEAACGVAHRHKQHVLQEPVNVSVALLDNAPSSIPFLFPSMRVARQLLPRVELSVALPELWAARLSASVKASNAATLNLKKIRQQSKPREEIFLEDVGALESKFNVQLGFRNLLQPPDLSAASDRLELLLPIAPDFSADDAARRRLVVWGGAVAASVVVVPRADREAGRTAPAALPPITCSFALLRPHPAVASATIGSNEATFTLRTDGTVTPDDVREIVQRTAATVSVIPGTSLPQLVDVCFSVRLRFASLQEVGGAFVAVGHRDSGSGGNGVGHECHAEVTVPVLVSRSLVSAAKGVGVWERGAPDVHVFRDLALESPHIVVPPTTTPSDALLLKHSVDVDAEGTRPLDGVAIFIELDPATATAADMLLLSQGCTFSVQTATGVPPRELPSAAAPFVSRAQARGESAMGRNNGFEHRRGSGGGGGNHSSGKQVLLFEDLELGEFLQDDICGLASLAGLRAAQGHDFVHTCRRMGFLFYGRFARPKRVARFLSHITFFNRARSPALGRREVILRMCFADSICECRAAVKVEPHELPVALTLPTRVLSHFCALSSGHIIDAHVPFVTAHHAPVFPDATLDDNQRTHFVGGSLRVSVVSGFRPGDDLRLHPQPPLALEPVASHEADAAAALCAADQQGILQDATVLWVFFKGRRVALAAVRRPALLLSGEDLVPTKNRDVPKGRKGNAASPKRSAPGGKKGTKPTEKAPPQQQQQKQQPKTESATATATASGPQTSVENPAEAASELEFADHSFTTTNGGMEITVFFDALHGLACIEAVVAVLQAAVFSSTSLAPQLGERQLELELLLGPAAPGEVVVAISGATKQDGTFDMEHFLAAVPVPAATTLLGVPQPHGTDRSAGASGEPADSQVDQSQLTAFGVPPGAHIDAVRESLCIVVQQPLIRTMPRNCLIKYLDRSGWRSMPSISFSREASSISAGGESATVSVHAEALGGRAVARTFDGGRLTFDIIEGLGPCDYLWLQHEDLLIVGVESEAIRLETGQEHSDEEEGSNRGSGSDSGNDENENGAAGAGDAPRRGGAAGAAEIVYRSAKVFLREDGSEIASVRYDGRGSLCVSFVDTRRRGAGSGGAGASPPDAITDRTARLFTSALVFMCGRVEADRFVRGLRVCLEDSHRCRSYVFFRLQIHTVDDPSEIQLQTHRITYRHGLRFDVARPILESGPDMLLGPTLPAPLQQQLAALRRGDLASASTLDAFPIAPICEAIVSDPDTEFFDGGFLSATFVAGAAKGDTLAFMTVEQQRAQYAALGLPPRLLLDVAPGGRLVLDSTSAFIGSVTTRSSPDFAGAVDLRIDFARHERRTAKKSIAPIALVSFLLNCVCYKSTLTDQKIRAGARHIKLSVSDGSNPSVGSTTLQLDVLPPLVTTADAENTLEVVATVGGVPTVLAAKIQACLLKDDAWTQGFLDFRLVGVDGSAREDEMLIFNPMTFATVYFELRTITQPPAQQQQQPETAIYDNAGAFMGKLVQTRRSVTLILTGASKLQQKQLDAFLRCVTFESKDAAGAMARATRMVRITANDGRLGCNAVDVVVKLAKRK